MRKKNGKRPAMRLEPKRTKSATSFASVASIFGRGTSSGEWGRGLCAIGASTNANSTFCYWTERCHLQNGTQHDARLFDARSLLEGLEIIDFAQVKVS